MQVIGLCRFSYPALGGFQVQHETIDDRKAFLYAPDRLEARFAMFEAFTLPSLIAQTDQDFVFIILTGDDLPDKFLQRLLDLVSVVPQIIVEQRPPGQHREVMRSVINAHKSASPAPSLQFRLDDDDAVAVSYVETLREKASKSVSLLDHGGAVAIDFNQGHIATPTAEGILASRVQAAYWSPALALMVPAETDKTVMNFSHHKVWKTVPTVTFTGMDMMVRGINMHNDSRQKRSAKAVELSLLTRREERRFRKTYNIDADQIRATFSAT